MKPSLGTVIAVSMCVGLIYVSGSVVLDVLFSDPVEWAKHGTHGWGLAISYGAGALWVRHVRRNG